MSLIRMLFAAGLSLLAAGAGAVSADQPPAKNSPTPHKVLAFEGGLVDLEEATAYVVNREHGIDALDLKTGKVRWQTAPGDWCWPLAVVDNRLILRARKESLGDIYVAVLDTSNKGKQLLKGEPLARGSGAQARWPGMNWEGVWDNSRSGAGVYRNPYARGLLAYEERLVGNDLLVMTKQQGLNPQITVYQGVRVNLANGRVEAMTADDVARLKPKEGQPKTVSTFQLGATDYAVRTTKPPLRPGVRTFARTLRATDRNSGKILWEHALLGYSRIFGDP